MVKCRTRHPDKLGIRKSPEFKLKLKCDPTLWVKEIINWFWHRSNFLGWWLRTAFVWMGHEPPHAGSNRSIMWPTGWSADGLYRVVGGGGGCLFFVFDWIVYTLADFLPATFCSISTVDIWQILLSSFLYEFTLFSEIKCVQSQAEVQAHGRSQRGERNFPWCYLKCHVM